MVFDAELSHDLQSGKHRARHILDSRIPTQVLLVLIADEKGAGVSAVER
jgi:hypothetical protein